MAGDKFARIDIKWDYVNQHCRISMSGFINNLLIKFKHPMPYKPRCLPYKCMTIAYGAKVQLMPKANMSELLNNHCKR
jgi:hypothetical protein